MLHELKIDSLLDTTPHKQQLLSLVEHYLDIFADCDADVGSKNLTFYEIDTGDVCFCQPVSRLLYGEMRLAVEFDIDKLVSADISRASTLPWAFPVVMA